MANPDFDYEDPVTGLFWDQANSEWYSAEDWHPTGLITEYESNLRDNQDRLNSVAINARAQLGLSGIPNNEWSQNDRIAYIELFKRAILSNPGDFTPETVLVAQKINTANLGTSANWNASIEPMMDVAIAALAIPATIGNGVVTFFEGPDKVSAATRAAGDAVNGIIQAVSSLGKGLEATGKVAGLLVPIALVAFVWLVVKGGSERVVRQF